MSYIDAGYAIALTVLAGYSVQLWQRRRRLERLAARAEAMDGHRAQPVDPADPVAEALGGAAVSEPDVATGARPSSARSAPRSDPSWSSRSTSGGKWRLIVVGVVLVGAFAFLVAKGLGSSLDYFDTVNQALASKATLGTKTFRLEGLVVPGSVHRRVGGVDFVASGSRGRIAVVNTGNPPQLFQPDIPVVVVGHFAGATFVSNQIIVDHTAQYVAQYPNRVKAPNGTSR